jgi:hypothetical protein
MNRACLLLVLIFLVFAGQGFSQVTISYEAAVTIAGGPHAAAIPVGERATITYTLDPSAVDSNSDPQRGVFFNAVLGMSVSFPDLGVFANSGPSGLAQTFNDVGTCSVSDQVFIFGGPSSSASTLGGEAINSIEVDFLSNFVSPSATPPSMLTSDALPLARLPIIDTFVKFETASGNTYVHVSPPPPVRIQALIDDVERLVTLGRLTRAQGDRLIDKLDDAITALARGRSACADLRTFLDRVHDYIDDGVLSRAGGQALENNARDIRDQLRCTG